MIPLRCQTDYTIRRLMAMLTAAAVRSGGFIAQLDPCNSRARRIVEHLDATAFTLPLADGNTLLLHLARFDCPAVVVAALSRGADPAARWRLPTAAASQGMLLAGMQNLSAIPSGATAVDVAYLCGAPSTAAVLARAGIPCTLQDPSAALTAAHQRRRSAGLAAFRRTADPDASRESMLGVLELVLLASIEAAADGIWDSEDPRIKQSCSLLTNIEDSVLDTRFADGSTLLLHCARSGCIPLVSLLVQRRVDLGARWILTDLGLPYSGDAFIEAIGRTWVGWSALDIALASGWHDCALILARAGAPCQEADPEGRFPRERALARRWFTVFRALHEGACATPKLDVYGNTLWHHAAWTGDTEYISLAREFKTNPDRTDAAGLTPLHIACARGDAETVRQLLAFGAKPHVRNKRGETPLAVAVSVCSSVCERLVARSASPETFRDGEGNTELHHAVLADNFTYCRYLLYRGFRDTAFNVHKDSPRMLARSLGKPEILALFDGEYTRLYHEKSQLVRDLLAGVYGASVPPAALDAIPLATDEPIAPRQAASALLRTLTRSELDLPLDDGNPLILHLAVLGEPVLLSAALRRGADTHCRWIDRETREGDPGRPGRVCEGDTLFDIVIRARSEDLLRVLIDADVEPINVTNSAALETALSCGALDLARTLIREGADPAQLSGGTIWHAAARAFQACTDRDSASCRERAAALAVFAATCGVDPGLQDRNGRTALQIAGENGNLHCIDTLLDSGADPHQCVNLSDLPLVLALTAGHAEAVRRLESATDLHALKGPDGACVLVQAIRLGLTGVVWYLLDRRVPVDEPDYSGNTARELIEKGDDLELRCALEW